MNVGGVVRGINVGGVVGGIIVVGVQRRDAVATLWGYGKGDCRLWVERIGIITTQSCDHRHICAPIAYDIYDSLYCCGDGFAHFIDCYDLVGVCSVW